MGGRSLKDDLDTNARAGTSSTSTPKSNTRNRILGPNCVCSVADQSHDHTMMIMPVDGSEPAMAPCGSSSR
eukprot:3825057-Rhodomonas_salina.8